MYELIIFYAEILVFLDGEAVSVVGVSCDEEACVSKCYDAIADAEELGHEVLIDEVRFGIL